MLICVFYLPLNVIYDHHPQPVSSCSAFTMRCNIFPSAVLAVPPGLNGDVLNLCFVVLHSTLAAPNALTKVFEIHHDIPCCAISDLFLVMRQFQLEAT
jgi:hypothetical protein